MKKSALAITLASLLSPVSYLQAQETSADETLVVTANRFEQAESNTLADVEVVTREDIDRIQAKTLPDVLRRLTGIQVTQNGGRGQLASLFVRGTSSDQVLVLVDGVRFARAAKGAVDFNQIPLTYVQRIEYVRGARASLYGSEAIGGVINIIMKKEVFMPMMELHQLPLNYSLNTRFQEVLIILSWILTKQPYLVRLQ